MFIATVTYANDLPFDHVEQFADPIEDGVKEKVFDFIAINPEIAVKRIEIIRSHVPLAFAR